MEVIFFIPSYCFRLVPMHMPRTLWIMRPLAVIIPCQKASSHLVCYTDSFILTRCIVRIVGLPFWTLYNQVGCVWKQLKIKFGHEFASQFNLSVLYYFLPAPLQKERTGSFIRDMQDKGPLMLRYHPTEKWLLKNGPKHWARDSTPSSCETRISSSLLFPLSIKTEL